MATLPSSTIYYREVGASDDAWAVAAGGEFQGTEGTSYEIVCAGPSAVRTVTVPTDNFLAGGVWHSDGDYVWDTSLTWSIS
jgi:hypothetical protein